MSRCRSPEVFAMRVASELVGDSVLPVLGEEVVERRQHERDDLVVVGRGAAGVGGVVALRAEVVA